MGFLTETVLGICLASIVVGIVRLLMPAGNLQRTVQTVTALVFISSVLYSVVSLSGEHVDFSFPAASFVPSQVITEEGMVMLEQATVRETTVLVEHLAQQHGVTVLVTCVKTRQEGNQVLVDRVEMQAKGELTSVAAFETAVGGMINGEILVERKDLAE